MYWAIFIQRIEVRFTGTGCGHGIGAVRVELRGVTPVFFGPAASYGSRRCWAVQKKRASTLSFHPYLSHFLYNGVESDPFFSCALAPKAKGT